jgi:hypothetical protein
MLFADISGTVKTVGACVTGIAAVCSGYVALDGPLPASRQWVVAQNEQLKSRLIDGRLETNKLETYLLRKEETDRAVQIQQEPNAQVKAVYQDRLNTVKDGLDDAVKRKVDLEHEKSTLVK